MPPAKAKKEDKQTEKGKQKAPKLKKTKKVMSDDEEEGEEEAPEAHNSKDDRDMVIASLQEQVRLLTIEVSTLRKHVGKISPIAPEASSKKAGRSNSVADAPPATPKGRRTSTSSNKVKDKGCSCKGNCSNKICGCMKKEFYCLPTCKCSDACQNQDPDNEGEDKENEPDNPEEEIETASSSSSPESSPEVQKNQRPKSSKNALAPPMDKAANDEGFNPMAPRRQLARSPSSSKATQDVQKSKTYNPALINEIPLPPPKHEPEEEELLPPEEINNAHVDWDKHMAQLVQCCKCKRSFFKHRLKTHEKSCIRV